MDKLGVHMNVRYIPPPKDYIPESILKTTYMLMNDNFILKNDNIDSCRF